MNLMGSPCLWLATNQGSLGIALICLHAFQHIAHFLYQLFVFCVMYDYASDFVPENKLFAADISINYAQYSLEIFFSSKRLRMGQDKRILQKRTKPLVSMSRR